MTVVSTAQQRVSSAARRLALRHPRLERQAIATALRFTRHPELKRRALILDHREDDLGAYATRYGIRRSTLERMLREGLDVPGYRFHRDGAFYDYFATRTDLHQTSWLDVGAGSGCVDAYLADMLSPDMLELCDLHVPPDTVYPVRQIDGAGLDYPNKSFDLVFFTYVLHHAADDAIPLLRASHRIARRHVVVLEDPKETQDDYLWAYRHDKAATFRGRREWRELFHVLGFDVAYETPLSDDIHSRHLYVLTPCS
ncbi:MAG: class I SAM-dependent methyltransferase [Chloroflexota bacterium]|nr:class I SAM-dependent methyltransferase [Chloroflexota bacterium]